MKMDKGDSLAERGSPLSAAMAEDAARAIDMVAEAVRMRRLRLAYHPVVLAGRQGQIGFHEGLIRVLDPGGRVIPAREFVGAVESLELGREIDCAALAMGLDALARHPTLRLSVNMSARSLGWPRWMKLLRAGIARQSDIGQRLILEISEASVMTVPELLAGLIAELRPCGISFALDGFGAGAFALCHFRELSFDMMKVDAQFSRNIHAHPDNQVLMAAFLAIARQFDMLAVAQGVEQAAEAAWLAELGMDCLQGYHFAAPKLIPEGLEPGGAASSSAAAERRQAAR
ncbi:MAG: EAL domain-containing protein [Paracoccaceae bacterium]